MRLFNDSIFSCISEDDQSAWCEVTDLLNQTNTLLTEDSKYENVGRFRCHSLCDAIAFNLERFRLKVIDGFYLGLIPNTTDEDIDFRVCKCEHSWLITSDSTIIDPYPVGSLNINPLIIPSTSTYAKFGYNFYIPDQATGKKVRNKEVCKESERWKRIIRKARESAKTR